MSWQRTISGSTFALECHESLDTKSGSKTTVGGTKMPHYQFMSYCVFPAGHLPAPLPQPQNSRWQPDRWHGLSIGPRPTQGNSQEAWSRCVAHRAHAVHVAVVT